MTGRHRIGSKCRGSRVARPNEYGGSARSSCGGAMALVGLPATAGARISRAGGAWVVRGRREGRGARSQEGRAAPPKAAPRTRRQPWALAPAVAPCRSGAGRYTPSSTPRRERNGAARSAARCARPVVTARVPRQREPRPRRTAGPGQAARTPRLPPAFACGQVEWLNLFGGWSDSFDQWYNLRPEYGRNQ